MKIMNIYMTIDWSNCRAYVTQYSYSNTDILWDRISAISWIIWKQTHVNYKTEFVASLFIVINI